MTSSFIDIVNEGIIRNAERDAANAIRRLNVSIGEALDCAGAFRADGFKDVAELLVHAATPSIKENCLRLRTEAAADAVVGFRR